VPKAETEEDVNESPGIVKVPDSPKYDGVEAFGKYIINYI